MGSSVTKNKEFEAALQRFMGAFVDTGLEAADIMVIFEGLSLCLDWYPLNFNVYVAWCAEAVHQMEEVSILQLFQKKYAYSLMVYY